MKKTVFIDDHGNTTIVGATVDDKNNLITLRSAEPIQGPEGWLWDAASGSNTAQRFHVTGGQVNISQNQHTQYTHGELLGEEQIADITTLLDQETSSNFCIALGTYNQNNPSDLHNTTT